MELRELLEVGNAVRIGRMLLLESDPPHLEAFSGNALYCWREVPTMDKYLTVKEVCDLTGLTRKHLYYFHHEKVVRAVAYANYSVEGYNGYKLYDQLAVEKLQQISLYYQLGLKRDEIRDLMLAPQYDSNRILQTLLELQRDKQVQIERRIAALEYLVLAGTKHGVCGALRGLSLDDLGRMLLDMRAEVDRPQEMTGEHAERFAREFPVLLVKLSRFEEGEVDSPEGEAVLEELFRMSRQCLGVDGAPFLLGLFLSVLGEGSVAQGMTDLLAPYHARAILQYMMDHPETIQNNRRETT